MNALTPMSPDPSQIGWPPTLVVELALKEYPLRDLCRMYGITKEEWETIRANPRFVAELARTVEMLREEGMSFKIKARLQAEAMLAESWRMVHDKSGNVPPAVRADLIKHTVRIAGLDGSKDQVANVQQVGLSISINL